MVSYPERIPNDQERHMELACDGIRDFVEKQKLPEKDLVDIEHRLSEVELKAGFTGTIPDEKLAYVLGSKESADKFLRTCSSRDKARDN